MKNYDIIVIGAGSAGLNVAVFMNQIGLQVLLVEKNKIGGDCLNYGCIPSKALLSIAKTIASGKNSSHFGLKIEGKTDLKKIAKTIKERQNIIKKHENPKFLQEMGIDVQIGEAKFSGTEQIKVEKNNFSAKKFVIATGSRPNIPSIKGIENINYFTNENIFENTSLPKNLLVIGDGPIGIEMAQSYQRLGSQVTVVGRNKTILSKEDDEVSKLMQKILEKEGVKFILNSEPIEFKNKNSLIYQNHKKEKNEIKFNQVLIATGRKTNLDLNLKKAGVAYNQKKIITDKHLRTTNPNIYACGDVNGNFMFTHWAETEAALVIKNILSPFKKSLDKSQINWVTYTDPEIATFGIKPKNSTYKTIKIDLKDVDRAIATGINKGFLKLYIQKNKIIAGTMIAENAGEIVSELILAKTIKLPFKKMFDKVYAYPTMNRSNKKAVMEYIKQKLSPKTIKFLNLIFKIFNR
ncbi:FAD-binding protein [Candidatus Peregrinibacteria bacterium]|nr:FAD-binding protein [Candidatus Peregrinibacteria bacterium]